MIFSIGKVYQSRKIDSAVINNTQFSEELSVAFRRYINGDWGDSAVDQKVANDNALFNPDDAISASYATCMGMICISTDRNHSKTLIIFNDEQVK